jgi:hypothetical protein
MKLDINSLLNSEMPKTIQWSEFPEQHNFDSAYEYLSLLNLPNKAQEIVDRFWDDSFVLYRRPDDILRAAGLNIAPQTNLRVQNTLQKIHSKTPISPVLLVASRRNDRIHIADGYHRICAAYYLHEGAKVPCVITAWETD